MKETSSTSFKRKLPNKGSQQARCIMVIDLGTQKGSFQGKPKEPAPEIMIVWETPRFKHAFKEGDPEVPLTISQKYTYSAADRAKLPKILKSWFDLPKQPTKLAPSSLQQLLGRYCMLYIEHNPSKADPEVIYANIGLKGLDVKPMDPEVKKIASDTETIFFNIHEFTWDQFKKLPKNAQKLIRECEEWADIIRKNPEPKDESDEVVRDVYDEEESDEVTSDEEDAPNF